jgi:hypothetical protein
MEASRNAAPTAICKEIKWSSEEYKSKDNGISYKQPYVTEISPISIYGLAFIRKSSLAIEQHFALSVSGRSIN